MNRENLRFLFWDGTKLSTHPEGIEHLDVFEDDETFCWTYRGLGSYEVGHGIRVFGDNELPPGCIFGYDWTNPAHRELASLISREIREFGRLVNA